MVSNKKKRKYTTLFRSNKPKEEVHARVNKEDINVLDYYELIGKMLRTMTEKYGPVVFNLAEDLGQYAFELLLKAKKDYNPNKGTFVTLAYLRLFTMMDRYIQRHLLTTRYEVLCGAGGHMSQPKGEDEKSPEVEGGIIDFEKIHNKFMGSDMEPYYLALIDDWGYDRCMKELGCTREEALPMLQRVADDIIEMGRIWAGYHPYVGVTVKTEVRGRKHDSRKRAVQ